MSDDAPINEVRLSDSNRQFIVDECVICGDTHRHGSKDPAVARGDLSHRVAHCNLSLEDTRGGYDLRLADDAERPERWLNWVLPDRGEA
ncbi:hypothetical protein [Halococcus agarilyticus]|uniref:hypothetical protein n=1 Tax=Halococcus agarilyticus TaxID=1232219 RepID=UPI0012ABCDE3|nr:hypothetical protein [Halococcus agarilyticus]